MKTKLVVIGTGGHAKVVIDTAQAAGWLVLGTSDEVANRTLYGLPDFGLPTQLELPADVFAIIAIGSNAARQRLAHALQTRINWATIVHPNAWVSPRAKLDVGTVVFSGAVVQADACIGQHVVINTGASVDHDASVGDFSHIAPGANLAGGVRVGMGTLIGAGGVVMPNLEVGDWCTLGAGGVAHRNLEAHQTYVGIPARLLFSGTNEDKEQA